MGTRNLTVVKDSNAETKVALYGQWDGYPSYSGIKALEFLRDEANQEKLRKNLNLVEFVNDEEVDALYNSSKSSTDWENKDFLIAYPGLHRDTGVGILSVVANAVYPVKSVDNSEFRNDDVFCEGIYEVDFSTNKFISTYNDTIVSFDLNALPSNENYLASFENSLTTA